MLLNFKVVYVGPQNCYYFVPVKRWIILSNIFQVPINFIGFFPDSGTDRDLYELPGNTFILFFQNKLISRQLNSA